MSAYSRSSLLLNTVERALAHTPTVHSIIEFNSRKWHVLQEYQKIAVELQIRNSRTASTLNIEIFKSMEWATARAKRDRQKQKDGLLKELEVEEGTLLEQLQALIEWDEVEGEINGGVQG